MKKVMVNRMIAVIVLPMLGSAATWFMTTVPEFYDAFCGVV